MDYRHRKYYIVSVPYDSRDMRIRYFKIAAPSMNIHAPYNHFKGDALLKEQHYDGLHHSATNIRRPDMMISCKTEDSDALEYELRKMVRNDYPHGEFCELTKEICGQ